MSRRLVFSLVILALVAGCAPSTAPTSSTGVSPGTTATALSSPDPGLVGIPIRHPDAGRSIYFVMTDRFANGDPVNDRGGLDSDDPLVTGFLPTDEGFHHGGDLAGLTAKLDYLEGMGVGAIWITPPFTNRFVQGNGTVEGSSSSYHGYWNIDWTRIDPHLGSDAEMTAFIESAHRRHIKVYFDIVLNHTGDVITYREGGSAYLPVKAQPYVAADGGVIDLSQLATSQSAPGLDPETSFPYVPTFASPTDATVKAPAWLNDLTLYHNRGNSTFTGESATLGDFFGLDDLFTEHPTVRDGLIDLTTDIMTRFPIDGFRVDTVKHVNDEFWPGWNLAVAGAADDEFLVFGEVFSEDSIFNSRYTTALGLPSLLDFRLAGAAGRFVGGTSDGSVLFEAFDDDDWYTDTDSNASMLVTFIGNHDMGRMGSMILQANPGAPDEELTARMRLGFDLLYLSRGFPVVYYGDEQGFTGEGGDKQARQDMFPTRVPGYLDDRPIGGGDPAGDHFDPDHPLYRHISELAELRRSHPTLIAGAHISRDTGTARRAYAFSRIDHTELVEYVVVVSNDENKIPVTFRTATPGATFTSIRGPQLEVTARQDGTLTVPMEGLSTVVLVADRPVVTPDGPPTVTIVKPKPGAQLPTFRYRIEAEVDDLRYLEVSFAVSVNGGEPVYLGTDDAPPFRLYWDNTSFADGDMVEFIVTAVDPLGRFTTATTTATLGARR